MTDSIRIPEKIGEPLQCCETELRTRNMMADKLLRFAGITPIGL
jgi:hypothetical protein